MKAEDLDTVKKVKAGKPLVESERKIVRDQLTAKGEEQSYFDSIASCAAALGLEKSLLRQAKRDGSPGFKGSRVYPLEVLPWIIRQKAPKTDSAEALDLQFKRDRNEQQKFNNARERGEWVKATDAGQWATELVSEVKKRLEAFPSTLAPDMVGLSSIAEAELRLRQRTEDMMLELHKNPWK